MLPPHEIPVRVQVCAFRFERAQSLVAPDDVLPLFRGGYKFLDPIASIASETRHAPSARVVMTGLDL